MLVKPKDNLLISCTQVSATPVSLKVIMSDGEISDPHMPEEIVIDILSRLPVKSLLQFRSVSKRWRSLIADTHLISSHLSRSLLSSSYHRVLLPSSPLQSVDYNALSGMAITSMELDCPFVNPNTLIKILGACNGLVCFLVDNRDLIIYNPSTRHSKLLLTPQQFRSSSLGIDFVYGFGCGLAPLDFRVVMLSRFARHSRMYPFVVFGQKDSSWWARDLIRSFDFVDEVGTFLNGALHWLACLSIGEARFVASFDVSEEVFKEISLPPHRNNLQYYSLGAVEGCLYVLSDNMGYTYVDVWVMKEYGVETSWMKFIRVPRDMGTEYIAYLVPLSFLKEGEVLLEIDLREFVAYDTKKKTFRNVVVRGGQNWFGDAVMYVESLVSPDIVE